MNPEYEANRLLLDQLLEQAAPEESGENPLLPVIRYGIATPGKRIRGALLIALCDRLSVPRAQSRPFAAALEMIHAYSLVHDDMPEMDNDDCRRGLPTCHKKYGPALALLAGDGILNLSMEYLLSHRLQFEPERFLDALAALYQAAGLQGMLGGQALDKLGEGKTLTLDDLLRLHRHKTGALLIAPAAVANALAGQQNENYVNFCAHIGLAFQIKDDILDVEGSPETLGKQIGMDAICEKSTFVSLLGIDGAWSYLEQEVAAACSAAGDDGFLQWLAVYTAKREK